MDYRSPNNENLKQNSEVSIEDIGNKLKDGVDTISLSSNSTARITKACELDSAIKDTTALKTPSKRSRRKRSKTPPRKKLQDSNDTTGNLSEGLKYRASIISYPSSSATQNTKSSVLDSVINDNVTSNNPSKKSRRKRSKSSRQKNLQQNSKDTTEEPSGDFKATALSVNSSAVPITKKAVSDGLDSVIENSTTLRNSSRKSRRKRSKKLFQRPCYISDTAPLDRIVLNWDYNSQHSFPTSLKKCGNFLDYSCYSKIPELFHDAGEYIKAFEPLIILEGWAQFQQSKYQSKSEDNSLLFLYSLSRVNEFVKMRFVATISEGCNIYVNDILLIWLGKNKEVYYSQIPHSLLIKVTKIKVEELEMYSEPFIHIEAISCCNDNNTYYESKNHLRLQWVAKQVMSMTPIYREYLAVKNIASYPINRYVLNRSSEPLKLLGTKKISKISRTLNVNLPQAHAIGATKPMNKGFYMIHGPPGTGKTKTVLGLVGYFSSKLSEEKSSHLSFNVYNDQIKSKIMICAPSNAAVDEVVRRLKCGIKSCSGMGLNLKILRIGRLDTTQFDVRDVSLDTLIGFTSDVYIKASSNMHKKDPKIRLASLRNNMNEERYALKAKLLAEADVICCTLSRAGHSDLNDMINNIKVLIVDEAAQATEPSCLIPLRFNTPFCIMVGDPRQLPPTVISKEATKFKCDHSLFARIYKNHPQFAHLLSIQYRMHPEISTMPSKLFYDRKLTDGPDLDKIKIAKWHKNSIYGPYMFFDVIEGKERRTESFSLLNSEEACVAVWLVESLVKKNPDINFKNRIGVITPYKLQVKELREKFKIRFGKQIFDSIAIDTIDGFQGQEKDIIIFSTVRTRTKSIGFLSDKRRMNVGLTRAKNSLFIISSAKSLSTNKTWSRIIKDAANRNVMIKWTPKLFDPMDMNNSFSNLIDKPPLNHLLLSQRI